MEESPLDGLLNCSPTSLVLFLYISNSTEHSFLIRGISHMIGRHDETKLLHVQIAFFFQDLCFQLQNRIILFVHFLPMEFDTAPSDFSDLGIIQLFNEVSHVFLSEVFT